MPETVPTSVQVADVIDALKGLGIPTDNLKDIWLDARSIAVTHYRTTADGKKFAAGDEVATVRTLIKIEGSGHARPRLAEAGDVTVDPIRTAG